MDTLPQTSPNGDPSIRLWIQSNTALGLRERWNHYYAAELTKLRRITSPGTSITFEGVEKMENNLATSSYHRFVNSQQVITNAISAEAAGYDAYVVVGMSDSGEQEATDAVQIPVIYAASTVWHYASWRFRTFSVVGHSRHTHHRRVEHIRRLGLITNYIPGDYCDFGIDELLDGLNEPDMILNEVDRSARRAVRDGANALIPDVNPLNALLSRHGVTEICGVPVLDTSTLAVQAAELLVRLRRAGTAT